MAEPMWRRIAEDLRQKIESGELGEDGQPLPSELDLRDRYSASRNTIRDAVKWLTNRGMVVTRPGQGTFVSQKINPFVTRLSSVITGTQGGEGTGYGSEVEEGKRTPEETDPKIEIQKASGSVAVARQLRLDPTEKMVSRHQERRIDGIPWSLQTTFYPMRLVAEGADRLLDTETIKPGALPYIEKALGLKRAGRLDHHKIRNPDKNETEFFSLPDTGRISILELTQTIYDESGVPFAVTVTTYPTDRNEFIMTFGEVPNEDSVPKHS
jgi:GntR family transcriptional regulator